MIPDRRSALVGESYCLQTGNLIEEGTVEPKSEGDNGQWVCISCNEYIANNLQKDTHCDGPRKPGTSQNPGGKNGSGSRAKHVLAWRSFDSKRIEVP